MKVLIIGAAIKEAGNKNAYQLFNNLIDKGIDVSWIEKSLMKNIDLYSFDKIICMDNTQIPEIDIKLNEHPGIINKPYFINITADKWLTYNYLEGLFKQPKTYADGINNLKFRILVKDRYGSLGLGIEVAYNYEHLKTVKDILIKERIKYNPGLRVDDILIYQNIILNSWGKDLRVVLIGGKYVACELRTNKTGKIQSNLAQGGEASLFTPTDEQIKLFEDIAKQISLDYVGIDMLFGENDELIFCEANACAFFEGITKVTGIDICDKFADFILNKK